MCHSPERTSLEKGPKYRPRQGTNELGDTPRVRSGPGGLGSTQGGFLEKAVPEAVELGTGRDRI